MVNLLSFLQHPKAQALILMGIRMTSLVSKFVLTLFIARYMGFEDLGVYGLIVSATFVVPAVMGLGVMYMKTREAVTQDPPDIVKNLYYYARYILVVYCLFFIGAGLFGIQTDQVGFAIIIVAIILMEHLNNDLYNLLLNLSKPLTANILHFVRTTVWICSIIVISFFDTELQTIENVILFWFIGSLSAFLGFLFVTRHWPWSHIPKFPPLFLWVREEVKASKVAYTNSVVTAFNHYIGHFLVSIFLGLELTGVYVYFMQVINAMINLLKIGVIQTARPKLINAYKKKSSDFNELYLLCRKNAVFFSVLMALFSIPVMYLTTLYVVEKPLALEWFPVFLVTLIFFLLFIVMEVDQLVLYSAHRDDLILRLCILYTLGFFALNVILIPIVGLWGVALGFIIMESFRVVKQRALLKNIMKEI